MKGLVKSIVSYVSIKKSEYGIRHAINELRAMNDRELNDLGLSRSAIEHAVRNGRPGFDDKRPRAA